MSDLLSPDIREPSSPEEDGNLKQSLEIDMKALVGDAVGNVGLITEIRPQCMSFSVLNYVF